METKYSGSIQKCVTCNYWSGRRHIASMGRYAETESSERGACLHPTSTSKLINNKTAIMNCSKWDKWGPLS